jgi:hypothetical protein
LNSFSKSPGPLSWGFWLEEKSAKVCNFFARLFDNASGPRSNGSPLVGTKITLLKYQIFNASALCAYLNAAIKSKKISIFTACKLLKRFGDYIEIV